MTLCIAAIGTDGDQEALVFATDRLVHIDRREYEERISGKYESGIKRYAFIPPSTVALISGSPFIFSELVSIPPSSKTYAAIRDNIAKNVKEVRDRIIQNEVFDVLGLDKSFIIKALIHEGINPITEKVLEKVLDFKLNTSIMLIGFDRNDKAKISVITDKSVVDTTDMFFAAIGSGYVHAMNTLFLQKHTKEKNLMATLYNVYKAKTNAEVHEGVGKETDLFVLKQNDCLKMTRAQIDILSMIYHEEAVYGANHHLLKEIDLESCDNCGIS